MSKLHDKIDETKAAYKILEQFVDADRYFAYLTGLLDAYEIEVSERIDRSEDEQQ